ncbi:hypothetical protein R3751_14800 [Halorubrum distributum]|uniref:hypothetical protein n=1 Tax=Halorubrum distributum TaxID=29283 RepID=UPI002953C1B5|nr:hypothetical protein [Halorubrum distributum]MDV7351044.1 hypothetical protein [Halorubrum distributum]
MPLTITDFIEQVDGISTEDIPFDERERINDALADLTGGPGGTGAPVNDDAILVSKSLDGREGFNSIQSAVNSASTGNTIFVEPGEYSESVTIGVDGLTLKAADGASPTVNASSGGGEPTIAVDADGVTIADLNVERSGSGDLVAQAVRVAGSNVTLTDNTYSATTSNDAAVAVLTDSSGAAGNPDVTGETFNNIEISGGEISDSPTGLLVADNGEATFADGAVSVADVSFANNDEHFLALDTGGSVVDGQSLLDNNTFDQAAYTDDTDETRGGFDVDQIISSSIGDAIGALGE